MFTTKKNWVDQVEQVSDPTSVFRFVCYAVRHKNPPYACIGRINCFRVLPAEGNYQLLKNISFTYFSMSVCALPLTRT